MEPPQPVIGSVSTIVAERPFVEPKEALVVSWPVQRSLSDDGVLNNPGCNAAPALLVRPELLTSSRYWAPGMFGRLLIVNWIWRWQ